jgi:trans-2,3-dihydro-3-hydroxyanthranilate isomerase
MDYHFEQVDVFTKRRFAGNPLAVFTDGRALSPSDMQQIAREMNLSETTFVVPPTQPECVAKYYIFTPDKELPFAGHPTVGTAFVLARLNASRSQSDTMNLEAAVGKVAVRLEGRKDDPETVFFTSPPVKFGSRFTDRAGVATALNLREDDLVEGIPIEEAGCPIMHPYVTLRSVTAVDSAVVNPQLFATALGQSPSGVYIFSPTPDRNRIYARYFSFTHAGTIEDPATGSAASPLGAYLARYGLLDGEKPEFVIEQGTRMGRQSFLTVSMTCRGAEVEKIEVGGSVVPVLSGTLTL